MIRTVFFVQIVGQGIADNSDYYYKNNNPRHGVYECHSGHPFVYQIREVISPAANPRGIRALVSPGDICLATQSNPTRALPNPNADQDLVR